MNFAPYKTNENHLFTQQKKPRNKKTLKALVAAAAFCVSVNAFSVPALSVNGNQVLQDGLQVSLAGNSLFWSNNGWGGENFYNTSVVSWLSNDWNSSIVRAAMGVEDPGGYFDDPISNKNKVTTIVDAAIAENMYVIIDWHSHNAHAHDWSQAINFFKEMAQTYGDHNNVIYEIYNEPLDISWSNDIKPYAEAVIEEIRAIDPDNLIVVGTPYYSQKVDDASLDPITGYDNIAYTLHYYAASHGQALRDKADTAMNNGIALFVTEYGNVEANGDGNVDYTEGDAWYNWMQYNGISHANWSINNKDEGASVLVPSASTQGNWSINDLTESGNYTRDKLTNWSGGQANGYSYIAHNLPATVQAEAYHAASDTDQGNNGTPTNCSYRGKHVDIENTSDIGGGCNVGWTHVGETLTYHIGIANGSYDIRARIASPDAGSRVQISVDDIVVGILSTNGGGWQSWENHSLTDVNIADNTTITATFLDGAVNFNYLDITESGASGTKHNETLQAESYVSEDGTAIEPTTDIGGGQNVGWLDTGDWLLYSINLPSAGTYSVSYRVASQSGGGSISLDNNTGNNYGSMAVPSTSGWQAWTTISHNVSLPSGQQDLRLYVGSGGYNINWINVTNQVIAENLLSSDGSFSSSQQNFNEYMVNGNVSWNNEALFNITSATTEVWQIQMTHGVAVTSGAQYTVCIDAKASAVRSIDVMIDEGAPTYTSLNGSSATFYLNQNYAVYSHTFTALSADNDARLVVNMGQSANNVTIDNVGVYKGDSCGTP